MAEIENNGFPSRPHMKADELACYAKYVASAKKYVEFGCGGSTSLALESGCEKIDSVESDIEWIGRCRNHPLFASNTDVITFHHADIGPVGRWGRPADKSKVDVWSDYFLKVWREIEYRPDFVLVDGRWRVSCCLQAIVECPAESTIIAVHDFWSRPNYHVVLEFADEIDRARDLVILRPRRSIDWKRMIKVVAQHVTDYR